MFDLQAVMAGRRLISPPLPPDPRLAHLAQRQHPPLSLLPQKTETPREDIVRGYGFFN